MAAVHQTDIPNRDSMNWDETDCLNYYGLLSLHDIFEVVGSQLTQADVEVLSLFLSELCPIQHPLDPTCWTVEPQEGDPGDAGVSPNPKLLNTWRRIKPRGAPSPFVVSHKPISGVELLLELERRGYISEGKLEPLLELLRVLTRHDLLPLVSHKKRRTVSPERLRQKYRVEKKDLMCHSGMRPSCGWADTPLAAFTRGLRNGSYPPVPEQALRRRRRKRGYGWSRRPKKGNQQGQQPLPMPPSHRESCDVRLRVRAEYLEHESALRSGVSSDKQQPLERQFELFSQASSLLRSRDLGSIVCDIKFTELENLEAFWGDYLSGALLEALKGVFITDSLRMAAGSEGVRLLISVDQDDYEEGCKRLKSRNGASC